MYRKLLLVLLLGIGLSACKKNANKSGCGTQPCTAMFAYLGVVIKNGNGQPAQLSQITIVNLRTKKTLEPPQYPPAVDFFEGSVLIASDSTKGEFSTGGDEVEVTVTSATTGQTKKFTIKISGGCNCHIAKVSGPDKIVFE